MWIINGTSSAHSQLAASPLALWEDKISIPEWVHQVDSRHCLSDGSSTPVPTVCVWKTVISDLIFSYYTDPSHNITITMRMKIFRVLHCLQNAFPNMVSTDLHNSPQRKRLLSEFSRELEIIILTGIGIWYSKLTVLLQSIPECLGSTPRHHAQRMPPANTVLGSQQVMVQWLQSLPRSGRHG